MKITLQSLKLKDVNEMARMANNINVAKNVRSGFPHPYTRIDAERFIKAVKNEKNQLNRGIYNDDIIVGVIGLTFYDNKAEVGYWIGEEHWGKGIAQQALKLFLTYVSKKHTLAYVYAETFVSNLASIKVLEKSGFYRIEERQQSCNTYRDEAIYVYQIDMSAYAKFLGGFSVVK